LHGVGIASGVDLSENRWSHRRVGSAAVRALNFLSYLSQACRGKDLLAKLIIDWYASSSGFCEAFSNYNHSIHASIQVASEEIAVAGACEEATCPASS